MVDRLKLEFPTLGRKNDALDFLREFVDFSIAFSKLTHSALVTSSSSVGADSLFHFLLNRISPTFWRRLYTKESL